MEVISPFKLEFLKIETANFKAKKKKIIKELEKYPETESHNFLSNKGKCSIAKKLIHIFQNEFKQIDNNFGRAVLVETAWSVTYRKGDFHVPHNHGSTGYAGIMYLDLLHNHPKTTYVQPWQSENDRTILYTPSVEEGDIVIVPKFLLHYSEANILTYEKRIISFDFV